MFCIQTSIPMKTFLLLCALVPVLLLPPASLEAQPISGFSPEGAAAQHQLEARFDQLLRAQNLDDWMKHLAARPHHVGSEYGRQNARFMARLFESWGYETQIVRYEVLFPTPRIRELQLVAPTRFTPVLQEPPLEEDPASQLTGEQLPPYNAFSADGEAEAELVYVNYGLPDDYEQLQRRGIDVKGKIVIVKYGRSWRGIKPKVAAEHGAIGCIIYSDPADDGYARGEVYPKGPFKNEYGVQRGSVLDMPLYPGDPLTPAYGATATADRLEREAAPTIAKIPVLPISYHDALPMLQALQGPVAPADWRGALPITYHLGPGPAKAHLKLAFDWKLTPAYNVIATLPGSTWPDQWIIRGNHHDAWVNGAADPISGMVALMEEARAIGELAKMGLPPRRTVVYCAWDAEEPGLLGSTEWAEDHAAELKEKAVVYINTDGNGRGFIRAGGSHSLQRFFNEVIRDVPDPQTGVSVAERARARMMLTGNAQERKLAAEEKDLPLYALGSGSDYTPFIQHLGIAALNLGFGGENAGGEYHSIYDSYHHFTRFKDPGFQYGIALAQTAGSCVLRLANAEILPHNFQDFSQTIAQYTQEIETLSRQLREEAERHNHLLEKGVYALATDPKLKLQPPKPKEEVPYINFAPLDNAVVRLRRSAAAFHQQLDAAQSLPEELRLRLNQQLQQMEQLLTREEGLPGRPWYKHHIYAPGFYTGYGVKTLPGPREALEAGHWQQAEKQIAILAELLETYSSQLDQLATSLSPAAGGRQGTLKK